MRREGLGFASRGMSRFHGNLHPIPVQAVRGLSQRHLLMVPSTAGPTSTTDQPDVGTTSSWRPQEGRSANIPPIRPCCFLPRLPLRPCPQKYLHRGAEWIRLNRFEASGGAEASPWDSDTCWKSKGKAPGRQSEGKGRSLVQASRHTWATCSGSEFKRQDDMSVRGPGRTPEFLQGRPRSPCTFAHGVRRVHLSIAGWLDGGDGSHNVELRIPLLRLPTRSTGSDLRDNEQICICP